MKFEPKTEEQIIKESLLEPGIYDIEVRQGLDETSKAGNDMIHLKLTVFDAEGNGVYIDDYLLENMPLKLRRAAHSLGLGEEYESGTLSGYDFQGKAGKAKIGIQKGKQKDDGSFYSDKNSVLDYIIDQTTPRVTATAKSASSEPKEVLIDDEIPF